MPGNQACSRPLQAVCIAMRFPYLAAGLGHPRCISSGSLAPNRRPRHSSENNRVAHTLPGATGPAPTVPTAVQPPRPLLGKSGDKCGVTEGRVHRQEAAPELALSQWSSPGRGREPRPRTPTSRSRHCQPLRNVLGTLVLDAQRIYGALHVCPGAYLQTQEHRHGSKGTAWTLGGWARSPGKR